MCGYFFGEDLNLSHSLCWQMRPEHHPRAKKLALALLTPYWIKNKLITIQPQIFEKN